MKNRTLPVKTRSLFLITLLCIAMISVQMVQATTITVTNINDSGTGSLRQALADAHDGDTIDFLPLFVTGTIALFNGQLMVNNSVTISGPGVDILAVDARHVSRVFYIASGKIATITGLTITNGSAEKGGGIYIDQATLTLDSCTVSGNLATPADGAPEGGG